VIRARVLTAATIILFLSTLFACKEGTTSINPGPTDVVTISDINAFITDADMKAGVKKTNNFLSQVSMSHRKHEDRGVQCFTCHHKKGNDDRIKQCAPCHKGEAGSDVVHDLCITCHVEKNLGPVQCQDCHKPEEEKSGEAK